MKNSINFLFPCSNWCNFASTFCCFTSYYLYYHILCMRMMRIFRNKLWQSLVSSHVSGRSMLSMLHWLAKMIIVAPTGSGKFPTYWILLHYIKHGITVVVSPFQLLDAQFVEMLEDNQISPISIAAANVTNNKLFKATVSDGSLCILAYDTCYRGLLAINTKSSLSALRFSIMMANLRTCVA